MNFAYTYVLICADGQWYIGSTPDIRQRLHEHQEGKVLSTFGRRPVELVYYEACRSLDAARVREHQLKTGFGRGYLNKRLAFEKQRVTCPPSCEA
jgi:putative endonuclease